MIAEPRPKPLLTIRECATLLGVCTTTAYAFARRGELPGLVRLNGRYYVRRAVFEGWLAGVGEMRATPADGDLADAWQRKAPGEPAARGGA